MEEDQDDEEDDEEADSSQQSSIYRVFRSPDDFPVPKNIPLDKPDPKLGIGMQCWSPSERYIATRNDNLPWVVWIWNVERGRLVSVMIQRQGVKFMRWEPANDILAVCCGNSRIYLWSSEGASVVHIPFTKFQSLRIVWNQHGSSLILADSHTFCIGYLLESQ